MFADIMTLDIPCPIFIALLTKLSFSPTFTEAFNVIVWSAAVILFSEADGYAVMQFISFLRTKALPSSISSILSSISWYILSKSKNVLLSAKSCIPASVILN